MTTTETLKNVTHENTQALADLLDDLNHEELTNLIFHCWVSGQIVSRGAIKAFRKKLGKKD